MAGGSRDGVKVIIINTQYVETDATSFKSVVQRLTGKETPVPSAVAPLREQQIFEPDSRVSRNAMEPVLSRGLSFTEFDRMFKELPPLEELYRLCSE
ncbi:VQ motif-containing protein 1-like [Primulina eburnea]|uniref:VQ motif-containing protein 1-like n=1 Tax=Primulina eburnea TaxID=1245227 RepID=UPI003C6C1BBB